MPRVRRQRSSATTHIKAALDAILAAHAADDLTRREIAILVETSGTLAAEWLSAIRDQAADREIGRILRAAEFIDAKGNTVRCFQSYTIFVQSETGEEVQRTFWKRIDDMTRKQMMPSYKSRVAHGNRTIEKANTDAAYWNENVAPKRGEKPIKLVG